MSDPSLQSPLLQLPYLAASQAQKHVTHNEALSLIDGLMHLAVLTRGIDVPPITAVEGARYLVPQAATGVWSGEDGHVALLMAGQWRFLLPREGWRLWVSDEDLSLVFDGTDWTPEVQPPDFQNVPHVGVNATADPVNRLAVASAASLFNHAGAGHHLKINKNAASDTAALLLQSAYAGRVEIGLCGDDNLHIRTSPDGNSFADALVVEHATGRLRALQGLALGGLSTDPASPVNGMLWYNSTLGRFRFQQNNTILGLASTGSGAFRNLIRNASFTFNQRNVSGNVNLAAGAYGHDGVKAGAGGASYTFSASGLDTTLTVNAGSIILPVEAGLVAGGTYRLSHDGTAQARIWQGTGTTGTGSYVAAPFTLASFSGNSQVNVEFTAGTVLRPQLESGTQASDFERRPPHTELAFCQRFLTISGPATGQWLASSTTARIVMVLPVQMRAAPQVTLINGSVNGGSALEPGVAQRVVSAISGAGIALTPSGGRFDITTATPPSLARATLFVEPGAFLLSAEL